MKTAEEVFDEIEKTPSRGQCVRILRAYAESIREGCAKVADGVYVVNPYSPAALTARVLERREHAKEIARAIRSIEIK